ncbi:MAG: signal peptidase II [Bacillota bacterium]
MRVLFLSLFIVLADQITKLYIKGFSIPFLKIHVKGLNYAEQHDFLGSFLRITFVENPGMAFGIDLGVSSKLFLSLFSVFASIGIILYLYKVRGEKLIFRIALALILAGAIGNLIDRVFYGVFYGYAPLFFGKVVDFLEFNFYPINLFGYVIDRFPIFNIADVAVTSGVILLLLFSKKEEQSEDHMELTAPAEIGDINGEIKTDTDDNRKEKNDLEA